MAVVRLELIQNLRNFTSAETKLALTNPVRKQLFRTDEIVKEKSPIDIEKNEQVIRSTT